MAIVSAEEWSSRELRSGLPLWLGEGRRYQLRMSETKLAEINSLGRHRVGRYLDTRSRVTGGQYVAAKLYEPGESADPERRMLHELQTQHRAVLDLVTHFTTREGTWVLTRWVEGGTLAGQIATGTVIDRVELARAYRHLLDVLRLIHRTAPPGNDARAGGLALGDIAAENLFWNGAYYLLGDLATCVPSDYVLDRYGRPWNGPPEPHRADVGDAYACGVILWSALTGREPCRVYYDSQEDPNAVRDVIQASFDELPDGHRKAVGALLDAPTAGADKALTRASAALATVDLPDVRTPRVTSMQAERTRRGPRRWPSFAAAGVVLAGAVAAGIVVPHDRVETTKTAPPAKLRGQVLVVKLGTAWRTAVPAIAADGVEKGTTARLTNGAARIVIGAIPSERTVRDPLRGVLRPTGDAAPAKRTVNGLPLLRYTGTNVHGQAVYGYVALYRDHDEAVMCTAATPAALAPCRSPLATLTAARAPSPVAIDPAVRDPLAKTLDGLTRALAADRATIATKYLKNRKPGLKDLATAYDQAAAAIQVLKPPAIDAAAFGALADASRTGSAAWAQLAQDATAASRKDYNQHREAARSADHAVRQAIDQIRDAGYIRPERSAKRSTKR